MVQIAYQAPGATPAIELLQAGLNGHLMDKIIMYLPSSLHHVAAGLLVGGNSLVSTCVTRKGWGTSRHTPQSAPDE